ncbi:hypothetical protein HYZ76_01910 [Candidatus Falkowbacteria bacterium]|nr:hypothetical protein [Candidatus Falkowbacteria bacterium]
MKKAKKLSWKKIWSREYSVQYCEVALRSLSREAQDILGTYMEHQLIVPDNMNESVYFEIFEEQKFVRSIVRRFTGNKTKLKLFIKNFYQIGEDYQNFCKVLYQQNLKSKNNQYLRTIYAEYQTKAINYTAILWVGYLLNEYWSGYGESILKVSDDKVREALFRPVRKSTVLIMQKEAAGIKGDQRKLKKFWQKYRWLPCLDLHNKAWSLDDVRDYADNLKPMVASPRLNFSAAIKKSGLSRLEIDKFEMIKEIAYIKDVRDDYRRKSIFYIQPFFAEIGRRIGITLNDVAYLTQEEIFSLLVGGKADARRIKHRQRGFVMYLDNKKTICATTGVPELFNKLGFAVQEFNLIKLQGVPGNSGRARGVAIPAARRPKSAVLPAMSAI